MYTPTHMCPFNSHASIQCWNVCVHICGTAYSPFDLQFTAWRRTKCRKLARCFISLNTNCYSPVSRRWLVCLRDVLGRNEQCNVLVVPSPRIY